MPMPASLLAAEFAQELSENDPLHRLHQEVIEKAAQQAVEDRRPHLVVTITASLSPVAKYHGLARRQLTPSGFPDAAAA
jgi:hypothetical protein